MAMTCEINQLDTTVTFILQGNIYEDDAKNLKQKFNALALSGIREVIFDLGGISFIGSSGIGKLLLFYKKLASNGGGRIRLVRTPPGIAELFRDLRLDTLFAIEQ